MTINALKLSGELKEGSHRLFWGLSDQYPGIALVGLGKKDKGYNDLENIHEDLECARRAAAVGCKALDSVGAKEISVEALQNAECAAEGAALGLYSYQEFRSKPKQIPALHFFDDGAGNPEKWLRGIINATGQNLARELAETPANKLTPAIFGEKALQLFCNDEVSVQVHDKAWIESKQMGALLSVAAGSVQEPKFVELTYNNASKDSSPVVLIGKGVTFDSGGISIKPSAKMAEMRADMGGAAVVLAAMSTIAKLQLELNLKCLIPLTENMPSGRATKPGDVVTAMNGKTIAVDNTDAEGRLILADALCYSAEFKPRCVVDLATLTGAIGVALGKAATGAFSNSHRLFDQMNEAGALTGDRVWRMPLWNFYTKQMTDYTGYDVNNVGKGAGGGSCTAAAFLREFAPEKVDWIHLDIAGVMFPDEPASYLSGMTGRPMRTLVEFLRKFNTP